MSPTSVARWGSEATAACGGVKGAERVAAVNKIEEKRKPEDFIGHRNRAIQTTASRWFYLEK